MTFMGNKIKSAEMITQQHMKTTHIVHNLSIRSPTQIVTRQMMAILTTKMLWHATIMKHKMRTASILHTWSPIVNWPIWSDRTLTHLHLWTPNRVAQNRTRGYELRGLLWLRKPQGQAQRGKELKQWRRWNRHIRNKLSSDEATALRALSTNTNYLK